MQVLVPETKTDELISGDELLEMGNLGRCELVEGKIVMLSPTGGPHGDIESNLDYELKAFVRSRKLGRVRTGEVGIYTRRSPDTVRGADVLFISNERLARLKSSGYMDVAPELIVEVMSPDDRWSEVTKKLGEYFDVDVRVVVVVEPETRRIFIYRSLTEVQVFQEGDVLTMNDILPGFSLPVSSIFQET